MKRALRGLRAQLRDLVFRRAADRDMDEELRFHLDMETEKYIREGLAPREARRRALAAFGGVERHRDALRERRRLPVLEPIWHDVRFGFRFVARDPGLALVAAVTIALGVGATTTVFSVVEAVLLRPLPLPGVERMVSIREQRSGMVGVGVEGVPMPYDRYLAYRRTAGDVFESLAAHRLVDGFSLRLPDATVAVNGSLTSGDYFRTLGVRPALGRAYTSDDAGEIVISHRLWMARFGGDPGAVGRTVRLDGRTVVVVGVAPAGFGGATFVAGQLWAPVRLGTREGRTDVVPIGRLREGVTLKEATQRVDALSRGIPPPEGTTVESADLQPLSVAPPAVRGQAKRFLAMLLGTAALVLLIAAANVAGVMLARGFTRQREVAVRLAIGAGRARLVRHLLAEFLLLFALGGLVGAALAYLGTAWLAHMELPPQVPDLMLTIAPDRFVLTFAIAVTGATGVLFGLVPALRVSGPDLVPALKAGPEGATAGRSLLRDVFVVGQVSLAVTLLLTAALFARSLGKGLRADPGFTPEGVVAATFDLSALPGYDRDRGLAFERELLERVRALPGVRTAALSQHVPLDGTRSGSTVRRVDDRDTAPIFALMNVASPAYFETMGIDLVEGRGFTEADGSGSEPVAVVNRTLADRLWPGRSPIGERIEVNGEAEPAVVVGMTGPGRYAYVNEAPTPFLFLPHRQAYRAAMAIDARAPGAEAATMASLAEAVRGIDPDVALAQPRRLSDLVATGLFPQRFAAQLVGGFGVVGLLLAALGIYGVLAYQIARRTREIGVRRALGATSARVVGDVVRRGGRLAAVGCAVGMAGGAVMARAVRGFLFGVRPLDPVAFVAVPALIAAVAILASWLPARRAAAVQASEALRSE